MSSNQAKNDPEVLRAFASKQEHFAKTITDKINRMRSSLINLGDGWRDSQYTYLKEQLESIAGFISLFNVESEQAVKNLISDAEILERYTKS